MLILIVDANIPAHKGLYFYHIVILEFNLDI